MGFGNQTIVFRHLVKQGVADELGNFQMHEELTEAPRCRHRPLTFKEIAEASLDVNEQWWRSTLPLFEYGPELLDVVLTAKGQDRISVGLQTYEIHAGVRPHTDLSSVPFKMTIISRYVEA